MIWTTPVSGTESDLSATTRFLFQDLPHSNAWFQVTPVLQAKALAVAAAHLTSLSETAVTALLGTLCPSEYTHKAPCTLQFT